MREYKKSALVFRVVKIVRLEKGFLSMILIPSREATFHEYFTRMLLVAGNTSKEELERKVLDSRRAIPLRSVGSLSRLTTLCEVSEHTPKVVLVKVNQKLTLLDFCASYLRVYNWGAEGFCSVVHKRSVLVVATPRDL